MKKKRAFLQSLKNEFSWQNLGFNFTVGESKQSFVQSNVSGIVLSVSIYSRTSRLIYMRLSDKTPSTPYRYEKETEGAEEQEWTNKWFGKSKINAHRSTPPQRIEI